MRLHAFWVSFRCRSEHSPKRRCTTVPRQAMKRRLRPEGIRITKVGLWFVLLTLVVGIAATNTGNNALFMVFALMLAMLVVSGVSSRLNLRRLDISLTPASEVFANRPFPLRFALRNESRFSHWMVEFSVARHGASRLVPYLPSGATSRGTIDLLFERRGRQKIDAAHVGSLFPLGFFRKGLRYRLEAEVLVYPEIFFGRREWTFLGSPAGSNSASRAGWGHELHGLRSFRPGDDPRSIHWKQSARTGSLVFMEREAEEGRRIAVVLDNAVLPFSDDASEARFERLVSEAATAVVEALAAGLEVELVTREEEIAFGSGPRQRVRLLESLALVPPVARLSQPLAPRLGADRCFWFAFDDPAGTPPLRAER